MMSNELGINDDTGTLSFAFNVNGITVKYKVSRRAGVQPGMVEETVRHFKVAVKTLMAGFTEAPTVPARTIWTDDILHGEARVNIFSFGGFPIPAGGDNSCMMYDINIFNEFSTAQHAISGAVDFLNEVADSLFSDDLVILGKVPKLSSNPPQPKAPQSELDKHFGERKEQQQTPVQDGSHKPTDPNDTPYLGAYDYKQKADYIAKYGGHTAAFDVCKMARIYNRDGDSIIEIHSSYNGSVSQYPAHDLKIKSNRLEKVDDYTRSILQPMFDAAQGEKPINNNQYRGTFYMFVPKDGDGKMYPVLVKLEMVQEEGVSLRQYIRNTAGDAIDYHEQFDDSYDRGEDEYLSS